MFSLVVHSGDSNYVSNPHLLMAHGRLWHGRLVSITSRSINRSADPSFSIVRDHSQQQSFLVEVKEILRDAGA